MVVRNWKVDYIKNIRKENIRNENIQNENIQNETLWENENFVFYTFAHLEQRAF